MKIVLVSINSKYIHSSLAPWYLLAVIKDMPQVEAKVIEGTINEDISQIIERIHAEAPEIIGFSCYIWNIDRVMEVAKHFSGRARIVLGGPEVSYRPKDVLEKYPFIDAVLCGEGEWVITEYLKAALARENIRDIAGICSRKDNNYYLNDPYISCEEPPNPYTKEYFDALKGRIAYFESSRGCPFSCAFCLSGRCGAVRFFDFEESKRRLVALANSGTKTIKFVDRTFNAHHKRTNQWLEFLMSERGVSIPEDVCIHFEVAGDLLRDDTLELMEKLPVGMVQLEIGLQSFNEDTLQAVTRKTNTDKLKENIKKLMSFGNMHIHLDLIMGLPHEDMNVVKTSFEEAFSLRPHMLQVGFLKLLYGAAMREEEEKFPCVYNREAPYEVISTPWLSEKELIDLHNLEDAVERIYNSGRLLKTLDYVLDSTGMDAFDFFMYIGTQMKEKVHPGLSLNEYQETLYKAVATMNGVEPSALRDYMVLDRLETDPSGRLPGFLRVEDEALRRVKKALRKEPSTKEISGVKRAVAILYSMKKAAYVDYKKKHPITGRFQVNWIEL